VNGITWPLRRRTDEKTIGLAIMDIANGLPTFANMRLYFLILIYSVAYFVFEMVFNLIVEKPQAFYGEYSSYL
jgi:hypothetical protein